MGETGEDLNATTIEESYRKQGYKISKNEGTEGGSIHPSYSIVHGVIPILNCAIDQHGDMTVTFPGIVGSETFVEEAKEYFDSLDENVHKAPLEDAAGGIVSVTSPNSDTHFMLSSGTGQQSGMSRIEVTIPKRRLYAPKKDPVVPLIGFIETIGGNIPKDLIPLALHYVQSSDARIAGNPQS